MSAVRRFRNVVAPLVLAASVAAGVSSVAGGESRGALAAAAPAAASVPAVPLTHPVGGAPADATALPASTANRYSLVHGCYSVAAIGNGPLRLQAAALGVYLLYTAAGHYVDGNLAQVAAPSRDTLWRVDGDSSRGYMLANLGDQRVLPAAFKPATGCATYPEAEVNATGPGFVGAAPQGSVYGTMEGHAHITALELFGGDWHCGAPFSAFGAPYALPASCDNKQMGSNGVWEQALDFGGTPRPADFAGWPTFHNWPTPTTLAEEEDYWTAVERVWRAGLRVFVTNLVDNEELCKVMTTTHNPCNDMASVDIQDRDLHNLQDYIDAQSGGPGNGFFRIVTDPFQARRVINQGKLAVVEGIEVSRIFGCGEMNNVPQCDERQVLAGLRHVEKLGVRTFFPVHEFDNAFGGSKMIGGDTGLVINAGNHQATGSFFTVQPCPAAEQDAPQPTAPGTDVPASVNNGPLSQLLNGSPLPVYNNGPQCNVRGLTALGAFVVKQMIARHMIIQTDHMDSKTAAATVGIAAAHHYAGVVSAHCCSSPQLFKRIYSIGGFVNPNPSTPMGIVSTLKRDRAVSARRFLFGFGYGSDMNGLGAAPGPVVGLVHYPFKSYLGNVTFDREVWGQRTFDIATDGVANYGLYADYLNAIQHLGGTPVMNDLFHGAEAYLEMWERAAGAAPQACRAATRLTVSGMGPVRLGLDLRGLLLRAGQPFSRPSRAYRYCLADGRELDAIFSDRGSVEAVATDAPVAAPRGAVRFVRGGRHWMLVRVSGMSRRELAGDEALAG